MLKTLLPQKRLLISFFLVLLSLLLVKAILFINFLNRPLVSGSSSIHIILPKQGSLGDVIASLKQRYHFKNSRDLIFLARLTGVTRHLQAGEYVIPVYTKPREFLHILTQGKVIQHQITLLPGWRFSQVKNAVQHASGLNYSVPQFPYPNNEGLFYPDTYNYIYNTDANVLLKAAYQTLQKKLQFYWQSREKNLPYQTPYQALIVASLIEKEAKTPLQKAYVARVIINRLQRHMPLQMDSTVLYALNRQADQSLTKTDLKINSPYNTYVHTGLPPTPIGLVSDSSLYAATHPIKSDILYFFTNHNGDYFYSKNYKMHDFFVQLDRLLLNQ